MPDSQLYVDPKVNFSFIAPDERSTDHGAMQIPPSFADRLDQAVKALGLTSRKALVEKIGTVASPKETAGQWIARASIPHKYRKPLAEHGISIDYINSGVEPLIIEGIAGPGSQSAGLDLAMIRDAIKVARLVRDSSLETLSDDTFVEVLAIAIQRASKGMGTTDLSEMARDVATAFRLRGNSDGYQR